MAYNASVGLALISAAMGSTLFGLSRLLVSVSKVDMGTAIEGAGGLTLVGAMPWLWRAMA